jgi:hypothetical protein
MLRSAMTELLWPEALGRYKVSMSAALLEAHALCCRGLTKTSCLLRSDTPLRATQLVIGLRTLRHLLDNGRS